MGVSNAFPARYRSELWQARLFGLLSANPRSHSFLFDDMDKVIGGTFANTPAGWSQDLSGTGAESMSALNAHGGGISQISSGGTNGGQAAHQTLSPIIRDVSTVRWALAQRFRLQSAVDAQARAGGFTFNKANNKTIGCGFCGPLNASNFVFVYDGTYSAGSSRDTGIAVDQAWHEAIVYCQADGILRFIFDNVALANATMASAPTDANHLLKIVLNGTTNAARILEHDWVAAVYPEI